MRLKKRLYIWLAVILGIVVLFYTQWDAWFGDLPEPSYTLAKKADRLFITPGEDGLHDRSFSWVSGEETSFTFKLLKDSIETTYAPTHHVVTTKGGVTHIYTVSVTGLAEGSYRYQITAEHLTDTIASSFEIKEAPDKICLLLIGDIQDKKWSEDTAFFGEIHRRYASVDALLFVGDMLERPHNQYWEMYYRSLSPYAKNTPFITVPGNHEYTLGGPGSLDPRYALELQMPHNGPEQKVGRTYYISYPMVRIIGLDTSMLITNYFSTKSWLKSVLEGTKHPFTIVMGHHGVYSVRKGRVNPLMKYGIDPILKENGVDLVLQGHDHAYSRNGGETSRPVYVTQSTSGKTYGIGNPSKHDVSQTGERFYSLIQITPDTLYFNSYKQNHALFDSFKIPRI